MRFDVLLTHCNTLFNPSDTVIKCFSTCTYINIAISVITRTGYNEQIRLDLCARYMRFLLYDRYENQSVGFRVLAFDRNSPPLWGDVTKNVFAILRQCENPTFF